MTAYYWHAVMHLLVWCCAVVACYLRITRRQVESRGFHFIASATLFIICRRILILLRTEQPASVCSAILSLQKKKKKKKKQIEDSSSLVVAEDFSVFYNTCNQPVTAHCSYVWRIFTCMGKKEDKGQPSLLHLARHVCPFRQTPSSTEALSCSYKPT